MPSSKKSKPAQNNKEGDLMKANPGLLWSEFMLEKHNSKTYAEATNNILNGVISLKKEFPDFFSAMGDNPTEVLRYGIARFMTDDGKYTNGLSLNCSTAKTYFSMIIMEWKPQETPEGKEPWPRSHYEDTPFAGRIGGLKVVISIRGANDKLKKRILGILEENGYADDPLVLG